MKTMKITLSKGGTGEKTIPLNKVQIPDLWHIASRQTSPADKRQILKCWHMTHDLLRELRDMAAAIHR
jgi:hypothetical protein